MDLILFVIGILFLFSLKVRASNLQEDYLSRKCSYPSIWYINF